MIQFKAGSVPENPYDFIIASQNPGHWHKGLSPHLVWIASLSDQKPIVIRKFIV